MRRGCAVVFVILCMVVLFHRLGQLHGLGANEGCWQFEPPGRVQGGFFVRLLNMVRGWLGMVRLV